MIKFEWDQVKNRSNQQKHGIPFEEAKSVFYDEYAIQYFDEENSEIEDRFLMVGLSQESRVLLVCHCERDEGKSIQLSRHAKPRTMNVNFMKGAYHER